MPPQLFINAVKIGPLYRQSNSPVDISPRSAESTVEMNTFLTRLMYYHKSASLIVNLTPKEISCWQHSMYKTYILPSIKHQHLKRRKKLSLQIQRPVQAQNSIAQLHRTVPEQNFVTFRKQVYQPKKGIPTGGCDLRQIADIFFTGSFSPI